MCSTWWLSLTEPLLGQWCCNPLGTKASHTYDISIECFAICTVFLDKWSNQEQCVHWFLVSISVMLLCPCSILIFKLFWNSITIYMIFCQIRGILIFQYHSTLYDPTLKISVICSISLVMHYKSGVLCVLIFGFLQCDATPWLCYFNEFSSGLKSSNKFVWSYVRVYYFWLFNTKAHFTILLLIIHHVHAHKHFKDSKLWISMNTFHEQGHFVWFLCSSKKGRKTERKWAIAGWFNSFTVLTLSFFAHRLWCGTVLPQDENSWRNPFMTKHRPWWKIII